MRKEGNYWVKVKEPNDDLPHWEIDKWYIPRHEDMFRWSLYLDSDILEIDERRIEREPVITVKGDDLKEAIERAMKHLKKPI